MYCDYFSSIVIGNTNSAIPVLSAYISERIYNKEWLLHVQWDNFWPVLEKEKNVEQSTTSGFKRPVELGSKSAVLPKDLLQVFMYKSSNCMQTDQRNYNKKATMQQVSQKLHRQTLKVKCWHVLPTQKEAINLSTGDYHIGHFRQLFNLGGLGNLPVMKMY